MLALYDPNKDIKVSADILDLGLDAVLLQREGEEWRAIAYALHALSPVEHQLRYVQVEKALGLTWACERFRDFLIGWHFELDTHC